MTAENAPLPASASRPVCIAGMHRSGTSLVAGMLRLCGVYLGEAREMIATAKDNADGFWEHRGFHELNDRALVEMGGSWDFPPPAVKGVGGAGGAGEFSPELKAQARMLVGGMEGHGIWGWKNPRNCLTLGFWRGLLPGTLVVVPVRNPLETAASMQARNGFSELFGWKLWMEYYRRVLDEVPRRERIVTHYDSFFFRPEEELRRVLGFLGIAATDEAIGKACALVKTPRRHHRRAVRDIHHQEGTPEGLAELYSELCSEAGVEETGPPVTLATDGKRDPRALPVSGHFPTHDRFWMETLEAAMRFIDAPDALFASHEFMEFFPRALPIFLLNARSLEESMWLIFHKGEADRIGPGLGEVLKTEFDAVFANEVFVILARKGLAAQAMDFPAVHVEALWAQLEALRNSAAHAAPPVTQVPKCAAVISAYNRPWALERTLPQVMRLGCPVVVVEDGSDPAHQAAYKKIREEHPAVRWIGMPENRGIPCAINTGISYWLADADVEWISYFEEDVDVHPDLMRRMALVQDAVERPLLTGRRPPEHPMVGEDEIKGIHVLHFHSTSNQHFHAHRDYWSAVLPIPAPTAAFQGLNKTAYCDWWLASWARESVCNTGRKIVCVPGLVSAFATKAEESTWGNESRPDEGILVE